MAPPNLTRNAPILDVPHPAEIVVPPTFWNNPNAALVYGFDCRLGQRLNADGPLRGRIRFHDGFAAVALAHGHLVIVTLDEKFPCLEVLFNLGPRLTHGQPLDTFTHGWF